MRYSPSEKLEMIRKETLDEAISNTGVNHIQVKRRPRLLSDNGPCYISGELKNYLEKQGMTHTR